MLVSRKRLPRVARCRTPSCFWGWHPLHDPGPAQPEIKNGRMRGPGEDCNGQTDSEVPIVPQTDFGALKHSAKALRVWYSMEADCAPGLEVLTALSRSGLWCNAMFSSLGSVDLKPKAATLSYPVRVGSGLELDTRGDPILALCSVTVFRTSEIFLSF